jgi:hypothetical protein
LEWEALTKLREFLDGTSIFGRTELIELTYLICARQKEVGKLAIWIDADEEVSQISQLTARWIGPTSTATT